ncbi:MAG: response regulator [Proteobacteria bacterium]|nr:response regulator [Pseudomonadota bacterium]
MKVLPAKPVLQKSLSSKRESNQGAVLIVDDDEGIREVLQEIIQLFGFTCKSAESAEEALESLRKQSFELMITDIKMPGMDGMELLKRAKKQSESLDIIMMTGFSVDYSFSDVVMAGASDIIPKPINLEEVEAKIKRVVRERTLRKELEQKNRQLRNYLEDQQLAKNRLEEQASRLVTALTEIEKAKEVIEGQNQKILKANWELEKADRMKSNFLASVSHELRTPLNAIMGFLGLVVDDLCENRDEEKALLRDALNSSRNLLFLINNMLDLAKIEAGKVDILLEKLNLKDILDEATSLLSIQARQKNLYFKLESCDVPPVHADRGKVWQILNNLIGNAIKFTEKGGVEVWARRHDRESVEIEIKDTGIGVPPEQLASIWAPFVQAERDYTKKQKGTGLGLVISKNLVAMMGGTIRLESAGEGKGSQAFFTLPIYREGRVYSTPSGSGDAISFEESL